MELVKPITSDHDLIELAKRIKVHLDAIFESNEITKPLPKKGSYLVLLRSPNLDYGIRRYNPKQYQGTYGDYCGPFCMLWLYCKQKNKMNLLNRFKDLNLSILY
ncbi:uncharacterized protein PITG_01892 [Phytophthora infestans T30-4]|uniref:Uncharacterized protein n=1 Tax=Phytophthora infestans (strain T30-4) TaxID=403677 RepID=D0MUC3_PHYIT|nr:uncharacterized protein PITG_01892 [Phytophthora infestans T30-4]EEY61570.1 conserved hypothetical protein [Phytophthora infestans T30-4]|eukprot:XP_002908487.1 conserved hypothetical protein [Phytophthora infestans T30-4]